MRPLDGIRVLDFTRAVSGPHATRMLADFGADVVKVEPPEGDGIRRYGAHVNGIGPFFAQQNCGKRSIAVDLSKPAGVSLCRRLAARADVVAENFRPGVMERLGLSYDTLAAGNPGLVYGAIRGYQGARAMRRAFANVVHAEAGLLERESRRGGWPPTPIRWSAADTYSSLELLSGVLAALFHRERTGAGQRVEVTMLDTMLSVDDFAAFELWDADGPGPQPDPVLVPTADGHVMVSANPVLAPAPFLDAMRRPELLDDERFATREARSRHRDELIAEFAAWTATLPGDAVELICDEVGLAAGKVRTTREAIELGRREPSPSVVAVDDRGGGTVPLVTSPQRFSATPSGVGGVAPYLGEHNDDVLREWLDAQAEVDELTREGVLTSAR